MNRQKTEVKVVVTSVATEVKNGGTKQDSKSGVKHSIRTVSSSNRVSDPESTRGTRTPNSNVFHTPVAASVRTPVPTTPRTSGGLTVTPKTPVPTTPRTSGDLTVTPKTTTTYTSRTADCGATTPHHSTPTTSISRTGTPITTPSTTTRTGTSKIVRTPIPSANSKTPATNTPRHGPPGVPLPKRLRKSEEAQKNESSHGGGGLQRSKSVREVDSEKKGEDGKRREHITVRRVLSSSTINVPSPARLSGGRLSSENKTPVSSRTSLGRPSSAKVSLGSNTPTLGASRRSSSGVRRFSGLLPDHLQPPSICINSALTPDVISHLNSDMSVSPSTTDCYGKTESTAISVGVRIRPLSNREQSISEANIMDVIGKSVKVMSDSGSGHTFNYDHCFWSCSEYHPHYASQETVYIAIAQPLLEKAYEGYNTCLFAYGQTGSGKSYTMLGDDNPDEPDLDVPSSIGVIPRFCRELFDRAEYIHSKNPPEHQLPQRLVEVELSYFEIYNERIYDLLSAGGGGGGGTGDRREALRVREHPETGPYVEGVARHLVSSHNDLETWLLLGNKERSIAATGMNDKSSRSHAVFTIRLTQMTVEDVEGEQLESSKVSIINLVDLAGSERVAASQSQGDRLKEGVCINKSLLTLGKVITALAESAGRPRKFIPYRESVLTYLLKESLGGNSRTAMIATISPCKSYLEESLSTLRYAQQARKIVNHNYVNEDPTAMIIRSLKEEVERLRRQQLVKSPSLLFDAEMMDVEEKQEIEEETDDEKEKERVLREKEIALKEKEKEKNQAIKEKETEIALLREQLRSQQLLSERNRNLEQRLKENEARQQQALESQRLQGIAGKNDKGPQLVNLSEDPQLSETLSYRIKDGTTTLGHSHSDLVLRGLHCDDVHCSIINNNGHLMLHPKIDTDTYVNGKPVISPQPLNHGDRVVLAGIYYFRVNNPVSGADEKASSSMDFYFSQQELLKEQEKRLKKESELALAESKAEMEQEMCQQRDQYLQDIYEASSQLRNKDQLVSELEGTQWKLEEEKRLLEEELLRNRKTGHSLDLSFHSSTSRTSNLLQEVEAVFNESVMEVRRDCSFYVPPKIGFQIKEANQICKKLQKPYEFMVQEYLTAAGVEIMVLLKDMHHQTTAKLTTNMFIEKLQVLRDIVQGEESEEMIKEGLVLERTEDVSCVPGFINKLRECINSSINCSFSAPPPAVLRSNTNRRRSSMIFGLEKTGSSSSCGTISIGGPIAVATAIHESLASLPSPSATSHPLLTTLNAVVDLHSNTQVIKNHITEPGCTLSDEELSKQLIVLLCVSRDTINSLSTSGHCQLETSCSNCCQLQEKLRRAPVKISTSTSRIFQGVKNEVESLVDEESRILMALLQGLMTDLGKLAIMAALPVPDTTKLKPGGTMCINFTEGIRSGLETLLLKSADTAHHSVNVLAKCKGYEDNNTVVAATRSVMANIGSFLKKFASLNAAVEYEEGISESELRDIIAEWVTRVESAADTILHLNTSMTDISNHMEMSQALNVELWRKLTTELKRRLEKLMCFAGLGAASIDDIENCSFSSNSDLENSAVFMEKLQIVAKHSLESVEILIDMVNKANSYLDEPVCYDLVDQWPKNCDEYQKYIKQKIQQEKSPMKSSLRSTASVHCEEKKVRFNISFDSSTSYIENISYIENMDTLDI